MTELLNTANNRPIDPLQSWQDLVARLPSTALLCVDLEEVRDALAQLERELEPEDARPQRRE
jgi:hypothetical protein